MRAWELCRPLRQKMGRSLWLSILTLKVHAWLQLVNGSDCWGTETRSVSPREWEQPDTITSLCCCEELLKVTITHMCEWCHGDDDFIESQRCARWRREGKIWWSCLILCFTCWPLFGKSADNLKQMLSSWTEVDKRPQVSNDSVWVSRPLMYMDCHSPFSSSV